MKNTATSSWLRGGFVNKAASTEIDGGFILLSVVTAVSLWWEMLPMRTVCIIMLCQLMSCPTESWGAKFMWEAHVIQPEERNFLQNSGLKCFWNTGARIFWTYRWRHTHFALQKLNVLWVFCLFFVYLSNLFFFPLLLGWIIVWDFLTTNSSSCF